MASPSRSQKFGKWNVAVWKMKFYPHFSDSLNQGLVTQTVEIAIEAQNSKLECESTMFFSLSISIYCNWFHELEMEKESNHAYLDLIAL